MDKMSEEGRSRTRRSFLSPCGILPPRNFFAQFTKQSVPTARLRRREHRSITLYEQSRRGVAVCTELKMAGFPQQGNSMVHVVLRSVGMNMETDADFD
jgi:hypothetical protein